MEMILLLFRAAGRHVAPAADAADLTRLLASEERSSQGVDSFHDYLPDDLAEAARCCPYRTTTTHVRK